MFGRKEVRVSWGQKELRRYTAGMDYDEKAEDAVDYEDIDEQYEGPEIQAASEESYLLPEKEFFSAEVSLTTLQPTTSLFDDENYDEDEEFEKEHEVVDKENEFEEEHEVVDNQNEVSTVPLSGEEGECVAVLQGEKSIEDEQQAGSLGTEEDMAVEGEDINEELADIPKEPLDDQVSTPLPVLCVEDGSVILRFSEIFGIHEPLKKRGKGDQRYYIHRDKYNVMEFSNLVEEDEEAYVKGSVKCFSSIQAHKVQHDISVLSDDSSEFAKFGVVQDALPISDEQSKDSFLSAEPMKEDLTVNLSVGWQSMLSPEFFPLDQNDWEEKILWDNSPAVSDNSLESCEIAEPEMNTALIRETELESEQHYALSMNPDERIIILLCKILLFCWILLDQEILQSTQIVYPQKRKLLESPKLILDLQDEQMLFEILDNKDSKHLQLHAGAMIVTRSVKPNCADSFELPGHKYQSDWQFNIANDKFYMNGKVSQQLQSNPNKRTAHGIRVHHSAPALKLQTMKLKLSNKDIAYFHRPKALWYPHDNEVAVKEQGKLPTQGPMKIIVKSLGGKGSKLHVDAEETVSSIKTKASKKLEGEGLTDTIVLIDFKPAEPVKLIYLGKELEDHKSLADQNVQPNSLLHLVRTKIHLLPRAQKLPGENKSLRPPGAFKKKSDLSVKDGHVFLMEYCEERPLLLSNGGMGASLCTYCQKSSPSDQVSTMLCNGNGSLGNSLILEPGDKSRFLGDIKAGCIQSSLETNMYRAPVFLHKVASTDFLLIRSAKGKISIRRIDKIAVVGQQTYSINRLLVYVYREFSAAGKRGLPPCIGVDELSAQFPNLSEAIIRKKMKECAFLRRDVKGKQVWSMKRTFNIPSEGDLRKLVSPEHVCAYESMLAGLYRLKHLGITQLTLPASISSAMSQLPDEAIALAAASHVERELLITPWNLSSNFVACTNQDRENIERLEITGVGDPSGRGLGFSYVRAASKAPVSNAMVKKKAAASRGGSTVTGTDADLRRLSMEAAREVLLKFNVPEEMIAKQTRWHRIAMIRKLSSEQATSGVKVDPGTISKYARGQRMSFLQLQQQTREKCQEIWDRQVQSLSAVDDDDENGSDSEANSDLDSFAGDLENLLDAEECEEGEENNYESKHDKADGVKGLKMRRRPSLAQAEEEIEDEAAEAAELFRLLMDEEAGFAPTMQSISGLEIVERVKKPNKIAKQISTFQPVGSYTVNENIRDPKEDESLTIKRNVSGKVKSMRKNGAGHVGQLKKLKILGDNVKIFKEKKSSRESFVCGACGQFGHMRTNKNCPKYGADPETQLEIIEKASGKSNSLDPSSQSQLKSLKKKLIPKSATKIAVVEAPEDETPSTKAKVLPVKFKCGSTNKPSDKHVLAPTQSSDKLVSTDVQIVNKSTSKANRLVVSNKLKPVEMQFESPKPSIVIRPLADVDRSQVESHKPSNIVKRPPINADREQVETPKYIVIRPSANADREQVESHKTSIVIRPSTDKDREHPQKKIVIKRPKEVVDLDPVSQDGTPYLEYRKTKKIVELSSFENRGKQQNLLLKSESAKRKAREGKRLWEEEEKRRNVKRLREERARMLYEEEMRVIEERERLAEAEIRRYQDSLRREREEEERQKAKKKKKKKPEIVDEYVDDYRARKNDRRMPERDRSAKRPVVELARYSAEQAPPTKRRRGGEVGLSNVLERIVETLRENTAVSFLFLKPVSKKEAPDYLKIVEHPMDLSTIRDKVRRMEYKDREDFRHDVWQITFNAHIYNDGRNHGIPPLADQLLELCDYLLEENHENLSEAEAGIESRNT
ncbi:hypothetical protein JRO89_XS12G0000500 [Xanthoceras sorbifolium]|uniref:Transcription initiation factor TFIID subunit 1 n=1 Tax=Xanthoceras sorbifolium TaxID=99658 RepID=A0ABQ8HA32_9ROSI|nr:hypothetical protein JRO89_XS12G0000500 [Xanthoceras sorbifolium]